MKTYCQPVFVAPFGHVTSISVVGFHVGFTFAHIPPSDRRCQLRKDKAQNIVRLDEGEEEESEVTQGGRAENVVFSI